MAGKRLTIGTVLEVILDEYENKGYLIYLANHNPWKTKMFGLYEIIPRKDSYTLEKLEKRQYVSTIMIVEDSTWKIIGKIKNVNKFIWPNQYTPNPLNLNKIDIYHFGDGFPEIKIKQINAGEDVGDAQPGDTFFPISALKYYRKKLRERGLYDVPEKIEKSVELTEEEEMKYAGVYGEVYLYYKMQIEKNIKPENAVKNVLKKFKEELLFEDTALQLYMGIAKAQAESKEIMNKIKDEFEKRVQKEQDYLKNEEWLNNQTKKIQESINMI